MSLRLAILCPGQGGQHPAMFDMARSDAATARLLEHWIDAAALGLPREQILSDETLLFSNRLAQPLIVVAIAAAWSALQPLLQSFLPPPELVAGYSVGEIAAYHVAGAISAPQAIGLAVSRAQLMDACLEDAPRQVLFAVSGIAVRAVATLLAQHSLHVAIETDSDSCIAGGFYHDMHLVSDEIARLGGRISVLPVTVASHTPLMNAAVAPFGHQLQEHFLMDPALPVLSGLDGQMLAKKEQAITALSQQMAHTIRWTACMDACAEHGITAVLELGPGAALSRMLGARHPHIACRSVSEFRSLQGVVNWLQRLS